MAQKRPRPLPPPRPEVLAFLEQIKQDPDNDDHRLILADWLEEQHDPRGTFVRLQVESARLPGESEDRYRMEMEADELLTQHADQWLSPLLRKQTNRQFERGLLTIGLTQKMLAHPRWASVQESEVWAWVDGVHWLSQLTSPAAVQTAIDRGLLRNLNSLNLSGFHLWRDPVKLFLRRSSMDCLRSLVLRNCGLGVTKVIKGVVNSPALQSLRHLNLNGNDLVDAQIKGLAESSQLRNLESLDLAENVLGNPALRALAKSPHLKALKLLSLGYNQYGASGVDVLVNSENFRSVELLDLSGLLLSNQIARALAESKPWPSLKRLDLNFGSISDDGAKALAKSPNLATLESLSLAENQIGEEGARAFAESPHLDRIQHLDLTYNRIGWEGVEMLHDRFGERVKVDSHWIA